jgi:hypothetical protein
VRPWLPPPGTYDFQVIEATPIPANEPPGARPCVDVLLSFSGGPLDGHRVIAEVPQDAAAGLDAFGIGEVAITPEIAEAINAARPCVIEALLGHDRAGLVLEPASVKVVR